MHAAGPAQAASALALGGGGGNVHPSDRTRSLCDPDRQAYEGPSIWIVSGGPAGNCGGLRRVGGARRCRQSAAGKVGQFSVLSFRFPELTTERFRERETRVTW